MPFFTVESEGVRVEVDEAFVVPVLGKVPRGYGKASASVLLEAFRKKVRPAQQPLAGIVVGRLEDASP